LYIIRTSVAPKILSAEDTVKAYKSLFLVEQAFRSFQTVDLKVRPIYHYTAQRVKAHVFLCMLAYYVEWHMRSRLAPILFDEDDWEQAQIQQESIVKANSSDSAKAKARKKRTLDDFRTDGTLHQRRFFESCMRSIKQFDNLYILEYFPVQIDAGCE
jgi:transposase